jgi:hypothetical protein
MAGLSSKARRSLIFGASAAAGLFAKMASGAVPQAAASTAGDALSVRNFGIKGDGASGNGAALNAMLASLAGGTHEVLVPKGDYLVDAGLTIGTNVRLRFEAGARFVVPAGVTLTLDEAELLAGRQQIFRCVGNGRVAGTIRNDLVFPEWWGAVADGLHPNKGRDFSERAAAAARNARALQAALNFAGGQYPVNGLTGTVSLTYGYYAYDTTLSIPLSVNVVGYGIGSALFFYAATGNAVESVNTNNSMLKDFFIAPLAGPTWNRSNGYGLYMKGVSTPIVDNVWSSGFGGGTFYFENVIEGRLRGLISDNANGPAFTIRGVGRGTVLSNCVTAATQNGACFDISGYDWHLIGCTAKSGKAGTSGYYLNTCENINMTACGAHSAARDGVLATATALNCNLTGCFVNDASVSAPGTYAAFSIAGTRITLTAPKVTANTPKYNYGIRLNATAVDCTVRDENITPGTQGAIFDAQPTGANTYHVRKVWTTDGAATPIWSKSVTSNAGAALEATVNMKQRGAGGESAVFKVWGHATTGAGGTTLSTGTIFTSKSKPDSAVNAAFVLTGNAANAGVVALQVTGLGGKAVDWEATVSVVSVAG